MHKNRPTGQAKKDRILAKKVMDRMMGRPELDEFIDVFESTLVGRFPIGKQLDRDGKTFRYVKAGSRLSIGNYTSQEDHIGVTMVDVPQGAFGWIQTQGAVEIKAGK